MEHSDVQIPSVVVIVLNWNGHNDTIACIESLSEVVYPNFNVIAVDNGSTDGSVELIQRRFPRLEIVETRRNLGFAEGNNVGMRLALNRGADYVFLLNNDTVVHSSLIHELVMAAERCPEGGIFTAKIFYFSEPQRVWFAGARWADKTMSFRHVGDEPHTQVDARGVTLTDYACGCALLVRSSVLRKIGLLDPKFFLTFEETDFCYRARRFGIASYYVPAAMLWHKISASFGGAQSPLIDYFLVRNRLLWAERHLSFKQLLRLYKITWWELSARFTPRAAVNGEREQLMTRARKLVAGMALGWKHPSNRAVAWGVLHYVLRRFGDAPEYVRALGHTKRPADPQSR